MKNIKIHEEIMKKGSFSNCPPTPVLLIASLTVITYHVCPAGLKVALSFYIPKVPRSIPVKAKYIFFCIFCVCKGVRGSNLIEKMVFFSGFQRLWDPVQKFFHKILVGVAWVPTSGQWRKVVKTLKRTTFIK